MKTIDRLDNIMSCMLNFKDVVWQHAALTMLRSMRNVERNRYRGLPDHIHSRIQKIHKQGGRGDE